MLWNVSGMNFQVFSLVEAVKRQKKYVVLKVLCPQLMVYGTLTAVAPAVNDLQSMLNPFQ
jgi:hypothetical protein